MKWPLRGLFNRNPLMSVPLQELAEVVKPYTIESGPTREATAEGWNETAQWLKVAFEGDEPKGVLYYALYHALRGIGKSIEESDRNRDTVDLKKDHLSLLKASCIQLAEVKTEFEKLAEIKTQNPRLTVQFKSGTMASISAIPFRKMPGADHATIAKQITIISRRMEKFADGLDVKEANVSMMEKAQNIHLPHHLR